MEKKQYDLCIEVLRRLEKVKVLNNIVLIGSWCIPFYKEYFSKVAYISSIRTRDIDLLVPNPAKIKIKVDLPNLLKDLGFIVGFYGRKGYIKLEHPELIIEFLVPERGRGIDKPYPLTQLGLNAQALRFLDFLSANLIRLNIEGVSVSLPHPVNFALHKLIISPRRKNSEKTTKDREAAIKILGAVIDKGETEAIKEVFDSIPKKWQRKISNVLNEFKEFEIIKTLR